MMEKVYENAGRAYAVMKMYESVYMGCPGEELTYDEKNNRDDVLYLIEDLLKEIVRGIEDAGVLQ